MEEKKIRAKRYLVERQGCYKRVLNPESRDVQEVLKDLAKFCRAHKTTFNPDSRAHAAIEGRREVWLRIQSHLNLSDDQLWNLMGE